MLNYQIIGRKKPGTDDEKFYVQIAKINHMGLRDLCKKVSAHCTATPSDVKAVLEALEYEVIEAMKDGKSVRLGTLGSFRPTIKSEGAESASDAGLDLVKSVNVRFHPGSEVRRALSVGAGREIVFNKVQG